VQENEMSHTKLKLCLIVLLCLLPQAIAQDDFLNPSDSEANDAARRDVSSSMDNAGIFDVRSTATGYNTPEGARNAFNDEPAPTAATGIAAGSSQWATGFTPTNTNVAGKWRLELTDVSTKVADLTLYQSGETVYGSGIIAIGSSTQGIAASGVIKGNSLDLDLITMTEPGLYKVSMIMGAEPSPGTYQLFTPFVTQPTAGTSKASPLA
jgi:hypothetical protein